MEGAKSDQQVLFDQIAADYDDRYDKKHHPWLAYWFNQRIDIAVSLLRERAENARLLDVGCGTGMLYQRLRHDKPNIEYWGCDISPEMLKNSAIPKERQLLMSPLDSDFPSQTYDYIVGLGFTSYLSERENKQFLLKLSDWLKPEGTAIVSYTNKDSWDFKIRKRLRPIAALLNLRSVLKLNIFSTSQKKLEQEIPPSMALTQLLWQPATLPLLPSFFEPLALLVHPLSSKLSPHRFCNDFTVVLKKNKSSR